MLSGQQTLAELNTNRLPRASGGCREALYNILTVSAAQTAPLRELQTDHPYQYAGHGTTDERAQYGHDSVTPIRIPLVGDR